MVTRIFGKRLLLAVILSAVTLLAHAKKERWSNALVGATGTLNIGSVMEVGDSTGTVAGATTLLRETYVGLGMTEAYYGAGWPAVPDSFTFTVSFKVEYTRPGSGTIYSTTQPLVLAYNKNRPTDIRKFFRVDSGANYIKVTVLAMTFLYGTPTAILPHVSLGGIMDVERLYPMSCTDPNLITFLNNTSFSAGAEVDKVTAKWGKVEAADEYDLEWAWVDKDALDSGLYNPAITGGLDLIFKNNATRVTIEKEEYDIPLLYDNYGTLFYRVRPVRYRPSAGQPVPVRETGAWRQSNTANQGKAAFNGHQRPLNWQASTSFAEGGKRKSVVQYFDGSLKNRQTVTEDNTTGTTVVAETFYDRQGRPAIQVLPTPTLGNIIKYTAKFNQLNTAEYDKNAFDSTLAYSQYCGPGAMAMDSGTTSLGSGAARYYSSLNTDATLPFNKFIPKAGGYPFTETRYTPDNTGRIASQGGVGPAHQITAPGSGRATKYYYSTPSQEQLDALFGTEVGYNNYYQKTMVRDANGQYSVSYTDMSGKTIATALAGDSLGTAALSGLPDYDSRTITEGLISPANTYIDGYSITSNSSLLVAKAGQHTFEYKVNQDHLRDTACNNPAKFICYDCLYDLRITISNDCGQLAAVTKTNVPLTALLDSSCSTNPVSLNNTFNVNLPEGEVSIVKTLTVSTASMDKYRSVYLRNNTCRTPQDFIQQWTDSIRAGTPCAMDCAACTTLTAVGEPQYIVNYLKSIGQDTTLGSGNPFYEEGKAAFGRLKKECVSVCDGYNDAGNIRQLMLMDLTPPSGQYANKDMATGEVYDPSLSSWAGTFSIFNAIPGYDYAPYYDGGTNYTDDNGRALNGTADDPRSLGRADYIERFQPGWAEAMLPWHPEYARLQKFEAYRPSHLWNERFENVATYTQAKDSGFLSPLGPLGPPYQTPSLQGTLKDPFFNTAVPAGEPGQLTGFKNTLNVYKTIRNYNNTQNIPLSLWQYVTFAIKQKPGQTLSETEYNAAISAANAFNPGYLCPADLDMAWVMFRTLYLQEKKMLVNGLVRAVATTPATAAAAPAMSRFINMADANAIMGIPTTLTQATVDAKTAADVAAQGQSTCLGYAQYWWAQLAPCAIPQADSAAIINQMVEVCKKGYDVDHPFGASSVNRAKYPTATPASFIAIIEAWAATNGRSATACNAYLIDAPKRYETPAIVADKPVVEKPDSCGCARITTLTAEAASKGMSGNLSGYLKKYYQTDMRQGLLDTLAGKCAGTLSPTCRFLGAPVSLPPVLQCMPVPVCQNCDRIKALSDSFSLKYPSVGLATAPTDSALQAGRKLFANFMNYATGFSYGSFDYLDFISDCDRYAAGAAITPTHGYKPGTNCDTAHWASNYGGGIIQVVGLEQVMIGGEFVPKPNGGGGYSSLDFFDTTCFAPYTVEARVRMPRTGPANNPYNNQTEFGFEIQVNYGYEAQTRSSKFSFDAFADSLNCYLSQQNGGCGGASGPFTIKKSNYLDTFRTLKIMVGATSNRLYMDNVFIAEAPHCEYEKFVGLAMGSYAASFRVDWMRLTDQFGNVMMDEQFTFGCDTLAQITRDPCYPGTVPTLCGIASPPTFTPAKDSACADVVQLGLEKGMMAWRQYQDSISNDFDRLYLAKCLSAVSGESLTVAHTVAEYHYTLYYYDRAGNLVKTIPPAGVVTVYRQGWYDTVKAARSAGTYWAPGHTLATNYRYNSLNQVVAQSTPDAGRSDFWYDRLGRLVLSQNKKQNVASPKKYSYTVYDALGRITEVGQKPSPTAPTQTITRSNTGLNAFINNVNATYPQTEVTRTVYDAVSPLFVTSSIDSRFKQLAYTTRNRVSYTQVFDQYTYSSNIPDRTLYNTATYYSYDIHGNVAQLLNDYKAGPLGTLSYNSNRTKLIRYDYDLISGKVNMVSYNPGRADQFYHRYSYDAENRLTDVYTTTNPLFISPRRDGLLEDREVMYEYYKHGPLARMELGQQQVQGVDYAYTIQGWLKGVNATSLQMAPGTSYDMGNDGTAPGVARDVFGFALNYYNGDYVPIKTSATVKPFMAMPASLQVPSGETVAAGKDLFNGNISSMTVNLRSFTDAYTYAYRYDQLNRLTRMDAYKGVTNTTNTFTATTAAATEYKERISYDPNGNIQTYFRNGTAAQPSMDNLYYQYPKDPGGKITSNRLRYVHDQVAAANYATEDIDSQTALPLATVQGEKSGEVLGVNGDNYQYDEIGNLVWDKEEGITGITWTVYGKIKTISKTVGSVSSTITYNYDPAGNRISKAVTTGGVTTTTFYVRDAQGNTMAVYQNVSNVTNSLILQEQHLYGSSRLGIYVPNLNVSSLSTTAVSRLRGGSYYELTNHLGNVLATVGDIKNSVVSGGNVTYYTANIVSATDYAPFGMGLVGRTMSSDKYRYGFNGKENDNEVKGTGNQQDYGMRIYDPRLGRFLSVDPFTKKFAYYSTYQFAGNMPIIAIDLDGAEPTISNSKKQEEQAAHLRMTNALIVQNQIVNQLYNKIETVLPGNNQAYPRITPSMANSSKEAISQFVIVEGHTDIDKVKVTILIPDADGNISSIFETTVEKLKSAELGVKGTEMAIDVIKKGMADVAGKLTDISKLTRWKDGKLILQVLGSTFKVGSKFIAAGVIIKSVLDAKKDLDKGELPYPASMLLSQPKKITDADIVEATPKALSLVLSPPKPSSTVFKPPVSDHAEDSRNIRNLPVEKNK